MAFAAPDNGATTLPESVPRAGTGEPDWEDRMIQAPIMN